MLLRGEKTILQYFIICCNNYRTSITTEALETEYIMFKCRTALYMLTFVAGECWSSKYIEKGNNKLLIISLMSLR